MKHKWSKDQPSLGLREEGTGPDNPVEVRRCLFTESVPIVAGATLNRLFPGDMREPGRPMGMLLVVLDRGRVDDEAILGKVEFPFRDVLPVGCPDARFLNAKDENYV